MGLENAQSSAQVVLEAMNNTESLIRNFRNIITSKYKQGLLSEDIRLQLDTELQNIYDSLEQERARIQDISGQDPYYSPNVNPDIFAVNRSELPNNNASAINQNSTSGY